MTYRVEPDHIETPVQPGDEAQPASPRSGMPAGMRQGDRRTLYGSVAGIVLLLVLWAAVSRNEPEIILPSPAETWRAFLGLLDDGTLASELTRTLYRAVTGVLLAMAIGVVWGAGNGLSSWAAALSRPALSSLLAVPPVVIVALGLIWFGPGDSVTRLVIVLVALPLMVITVQESVHNIDRDLIEMAAVFDLPRMAVLRHVIAPGIASPVLAATSVTVGQAIRVSVMAELLSSTNGVGAEVARARTNLATADLFAWIVALIILAIVVEAGVLRPVTARLLRWRGGIPMVTR